MKTKISVREKQIHLEFKDINVKGAFISDKQISMKAPNIIPNKLNLNSKGNCVTLCCDKHVDFLCKSTKYQLYVFTDTGLISEFDLENSIVAHEKIELGETCVELVYDKGSLFIKVVPLVTVKEAIVDQVSDNAFKFIGDSNLDQYFISIQKRMHGSVFEYHPKNILLPIQDNKFEINLDDLVAFNIGDHDIFDFYLFVEGKRIPILINASINSSHKPKGKGLLYKLYKTGRGSLAIYFATSFRLVCQSIELGGNTKIRAYINNKQPQILENVEIEKVVMVHYNDHGYLGKESFSPSFNYEVLNGHELTIIINEDLYTILPYKEFMELSISLSIKIDNIVIQFILNYEDGLSLVEEKEPQCFTVSRGNSNELVVNRDIKQRSEQISLAIFGSCYSRRPFSTSAYFNKDYKNRYNVKLTQFHTSIISTVNKQISVYDEKIFEHFHPTVRDYIKSDFQKDFFRKLKNTKVDYLIIDVYTDFQKGSIKFKDGRVITMSNYIEQQCDYLLTQDLEDSMYLSPFTSSVFFEEWENSVDIFCQNLKKIISENRIIIHYINAATKYKDRDGNIKNYNVNLNKIRAMNMIADYMSDYLVKKLPNAITIDSRGLDYIGDETSPDGLLIHHYESGYYKDVLKLIDEAIVKATAKRSKRTILEFLTFNRF